MEEKKVIDGFFIKANRVITKNDIYELCTNLRNKFDEKYGVGHEMMYEGIYEKEGGICFKNIPGYPDYYKSGGCGLTCWPQTENNLENWKNDNTQIVRSKRMRTILIVKDCVLNWTLDELKIFEDCLNEIGIERIGRYPSKKDLLEGNIEYID